jgi:hypothetical protein
MVIVVAVGLAVAGVFFVLASSRTQRPPLTKLPVRSVLSHARPLVWLDEQFLLAGVDHKIVKLDAHDSKIVEVVSEPYFSGMGYECFSRDGGRFAVTEPEKQGGSTYFGNMVYRWVKDWNQPEQFEELKTCEAWNTNPHDCTAADYHEARGDEKWTEQLLKASDGRTNLYYRGSGLTSPHERVATITRDGHTKEVWLETTPVFVTSQVEVRSDFDEAAGLYLWYLSTSDFNVAGHHWPLKAWWVAPEGRVTKMVLLPHGPWIRPFTTLYLLSNFSCGPPCYSHMEMWAGNGEIYIAVWGKAIAGAVEGVYRLDAAGQAWEKIIAGALDNGLVLSPSGCQIGYTTGGQLRVMNVCANGDG